MSLRHAAPRRHKGSLLVFGLAFALLIVSTYLLFVGNTKSRLSYVQASMVASAVAVVAAVASLLIPRRR